jgi:hypothetical protein
MMGDGEETGERTSRVDCPGSVELGLSSAPARIPAGHVPIM